MFVKKSTYDRWLNQYNNIKELYNSGNTFIKSCNETGISATTFYKICKALDKPNVTDSSQRINVSKYNLKKNKTSKYVKKDNKSNKKRTMNEQNGGNDIETINNDKKLSENIDDNEDIGNIETLRQKINKKYIELSKK